MSDEKIGEGKTDYESFGKDCGCAGEILTDSGGCGGVPLYMRRILGACIGVDGL